ncbi:hypothetical protein [Micromonospora thermarum]|uniref:EVE domain-containing protein n=1 Tax=Micromonospora thermarum TaxID=2720024 RepID=A0ABX0ZDM6_9ACTN|nr:hypothetical protein [Micromonospora thermarum]NJP34381.1 hypothetical protein [Micromonospora thermarum]
MSERRVDLDRLGAWLIKGNADQSDLAARFTREPHVRSWCVRPGYRAPLMAPGQPAVFWASGSRGRLRYGVWGTGRVAGAPVPGDGTWTVPLDLTILPESDRLAREVLRADGRLATAEVLRQPQAANPSFLTVAEYAALCEHLTARR